MTSFTTHVTCGYRAESPLVVQRLMCAAFCIAHCLTTTLVPLSGLSEEDVKAIAAAVKKNFDQVDSSSCISAGSSMSKVTQLEVGELIDKEK
jgi:hypothetical protein